MVGETDRHGDGRSETNIQRDKGNGGMAYKETETDTQETEKGRTEMMTETHALTGKQTDRHPQILEERERQRRLRAARDRETERQTDRQTDRQRQRRLRAARDRETEREREK